MSILYYGSDGKIHELVDKNTLMHYNHNHDALGRFSKGNGRGILRKNQTEKKIHLQARTLASQSLASQLRKHPSDEIDWRDSWIRGYYKRDHHDIQGKPYRDKEFHYYEKYRENTEREIRNYYEQNKDFIKPTSSQSIDNIIDDNVQKSYIDAVQNNIYNPASEYAERKKKMR